MRFRGNGLFINFVSLLPFKVDGVASSLIQNDTIMRTTNSKRSIGASTFVPHLGL